MDFKNKKVLITGGCSGIGKIMARKSLERGASNLIIWDINEEGLAKTKEEFANFGKEISTYKVDVSNLDEIKIAAQRVRTEVGKVDILINNAGVQIESDTWQTNTTESIPMEILRKTFDINFFGMVELTQKLLPLIRKSEAGRIVNLTSILGSLEFHATPGSNTYNTKTFAYNTSKTAVNSFTIHLAHLLKDTNIKVNAAHPGWVQTDMGGKGAHLTPEQGASTSIMLALIDDDGHHGSYLHNDSILPW